MYNAVRPVNMRKFGKVKGRKYSAEAVVAACVYVKFGSLYI